MSYDVTGPLESYKNTFTGYTTSVNAVKNELESSFNFGIDNGLQEYYDFWGNLNNSNVLPVTDFTGYYASLESEAQASIDLINDNFMGMLGMLSQLDQYLCFAADAFSRAVDTAWAFGRGNAYITVRTSQNDDGTYGILKDGLQLYQTDINFILAELNDKVFNMDTSKRSDRAYLTDLRDNYFIPKIRELDAILKLAEDEFVKLVELAKNCHLLLADWLPRCFRLLTTASLTFNLSTKLVKIGDKGLIDGSPLSIENRVGMSVAKYWRKKVVADRSNYGDCLSSAIVSGLEAIGVTGKIEAFVDESWDMYITKV